MVNALFNQFTRFMFYIFNIFIFPESKYWRLNNVMVMNHIYVTKYTYLTQALYE